MRKSQVARKVEKWTDKYQRLFKGKSTLTKPTKNFRNKVGSQRDGSSTVVETIYKSLKRVGRAKSGTKIRDNMNINLKVGIMGVNEPKKTPKANKVKVHLPPTPSLLDAKSKSTSMNFLSPNDLVTFTRNRGDYYDGAMNPFRTRNRDRIKKASSNA